MLLKKMATEFKRLQSIKETVREQNSELSSKQELNEDPYQLGNILPATSSLERVVETESIFTESEGFSIDNSVRDMKEYPIPVNQYDMKVNPPPKR